MKTIPINKTGLITQGGDEIRYVRVVDDSDSTGGFLVLLSNNPQFSDGFDDWVEDHDSLIRYFDEAGWVVVWDP